ncbi:PEP-CTERM sorting domain-containing protein [Roseateles sp.]|uniref:PEP-CTERM sorting domain-containing protein n=1 Tax=Roseateles sp. TaxID=1971397 RepID=UPI00268EE690
MKPSRNLLSKRVNHCSRSIIASAMMSVFLAPMAMADSVPPGIRTGKTGTENNRSDLFLTLIDPLNQVSYVLNLNLDASDFYINAQQDAGSYYFLTLDPANDASLQGFVNRSGVSMSSARWAVMGVTYTPVAGDPNIAVYTTAENNGLVTKQQASFDVIATMNNGSLRTSLAPKLSDWVSFKLNPAQVGDPNLPVLSTTLNNGTPLGSVLSSADTSATYAGAANAWTSDVCRSGTFVCPTNPVGISSWFYRSKVNGTSSLAKVAFDEFDNKSSDGYWGFIKDPNSSKYFLSYTLQGSGPVNLIKAAKGTADYAAAIARVNTTDYAASLGPARLINVAANDVAFSGLTLNTTGGLNISAVPEPQTWGLMALGGLLLAAHGRRQRRERRRA